MGGLCLWGGRWEMCVCPAMQDDVHELAEPNTNINVNFNANALRFLGCLMVWCGFVPHGVGVMVRTSPQAPGHRSHPPRMHPGRTGGSAPRPGCELCQHRQAHGRQWVARACLSCVRASHNQPQGGVGSATRTVDGAKLLITVKEVLHLLS